MLSQPEPPNEVTSLDAAGALPLHFGRQRRGASEFIRWMFLA